ncbi:hypothetical protein, partial [Shewanella sp. 1180_01]|uniref:hypothetical protein n=1 Tax=Shewanella sp. 1180_01 TaxID=2604451 RepID=UPI0040648F3E
SIVKFSDRYTRELTRLSTCMEVTVGGKDAAVEPSGMSLWRVTGIQVLNLLANQKGYFIVSDR